MVLAASIWVTLVALTDLGGHKRHHRSQLTVLAEGVFQVVDCVLDGSLAGHPGLHCKASNCQHSQPGIAHLQQCHVLLSASTCCLYIRFLMVNKVMAWLSAPGHATKW